MSNSIDSQNQDPIESSDATQTSVSTSTTEVYLTTPNDLFAQVACHPIQVDQNSIQLPIMTMQNDNLYLFAPFGLMVISNIKPTQPKHQSPRIQNSISPRTPARATGILNHFVLSAHVRDVNSKLFKLQRGDIITFEFVEPNGHYTMPKRVEIFARNRCYPYKPVGVSVAVDKATDKPLHYQHIGTIVTKGTTFWEPLVVTRRIIDEQTIVTVEAQFFTSPYSDDRLNGKRYTSFFAVASYISPKLMSDAFSVNAGNSKKPLHMIDNKRKHENVEIPIERPTKKLREEFTFLISIEVERQRYIREPAISKIAKFVHWSAIDQSMDEEEGRLYFIATAGVDKKIVGIATVQSVSTHDVAVTQFAIRDTWQMEKNVEQELYNSVRNHYRGKTIYGFFSRTNKEAKSGFARLGAKKTGIPNNIVNPEEYSTLVWN